jgi:integrase
MSATPEQATFVKVAEHLFRNESSGVYYARAKRGGKRFHAALRLESGEGIRDQALAKRALRSWLNDLDNVNADAYRSGEAFAVVEKRVDEATGKETKVLTGGFTKRWLDLQLPNLKPGTIERRMLYIRSLAPFFKDTPMSRITAAQCEAWVKERATKVAKLTFKYELAVLRAIFRAALEQGAIIKDPSRGIKGPKGTPRKLVEKKIHIPTKQEFAALVQTIRKSSTNAKPGSDGYAASLAENQRKAKAGADLVEFLAYSGCRVGEATALRWRDVDLKAGVIRIQGKAGMTAREGGTKNSLDREVPIMAPMRTLFQQMRAASNPKADDFIHPIASAKKCLMTACDKNHLNIKPHFTHHDFRHYFVTTCIEAGVPIPTITDWIGHQDGGALALSTYKHIRKEHSLQMAALVDFGPAPLAA